MCSRVMPAHFRRVRCTGGSWWLARCGGAWPASWPNQPCIAALPTRILPCHAALCCACCAGDLDAEDLSDLEDFIVCNPGGQRAAPQPHIPTRLA